MPSEAEIEKIINLYESGLSQGEIAKEMGKGKTTVHDWIHDLIRKGILKERTNGDRSGTKKATDAKAFYDRQRRLDLNNKWFIKIEKMLDDAKTPNDLRTLATPYGVAEDKRRLLEPLQAETTGSAAIIKFNELLENGTSTIKPETETEHPGSEGEA